MEQEKRGAGDALRTLDVFASVGVSHFDITHTNIDEQKRGFRPKQSLSQIRTPMPFLVASAARRQNKVIIRPHSAPPVLRIQLDDLAEAGLDRLRPFAFTIVATSPGTHQEWVAVKGEFADPRDFARRLRKGTGADPSASGAIRVAGTANFKPKYEPDFPMIRITESYDGQTVSPKGPASGRAGCGS